MELFIGRTDKSVTFSLPESFAYDIRNVDYDE